MRGCKGLGSRDAGVDGLTWFHEDILKTILSSSSSGFRSTQVRPGK